jgi:protein-L-isoaspartate(D-aspartate) O-methyltransferase
MDRETRLDIIRRAYAKRVLAAAGVSDRRVESAFARVKREDFLGPGPWQILRWERGYETTPNRNPVYLYDDVVVAILPERNLNNGQPSFLARLIAGAAPRAGEHAVHIGAGVGYYTAMLARLVGRTGRVTAIELDPALADRLAANFAGRRALGWPSSRRTASSSMPARPGRLIFGLIGSPMADGSSCH